MNFTLTNENCFDMLARLEQLLDDLESELDDLETQLHHCESLRDDLARELQGKGDEE